MWPVVDADSSIDAATIVHTMRAQASKSPHHLLLLLELFEDHLKRTLLPFNKVIANINNVDDWPRVSISDTKLHAPPKQQPV